MVIRDDGKAVGCLNCGTWIEKGDPFEIQVFMPEDTESLRPFGPYCADCWPSVHVCSCCSTAHTGDSIRLLDSSEWVCNDCEESLVICPMCDKRVHSLGKTGNCPDCEDRHYFKCTECHELHLKASEGLVKMLLAKNMKQYSSFFRKYGTKVCVSCYEKKIVKFKKRDVYKCKRCKEYFFGSKDYCGNCAHHTGECGICGKMHHTMSVRPLLGLGYMKICINCKDKVASCGSCNTYSLKSEMKSIKGTLLESIVCRACYASIEERHTQECKSCFSFATLDEDGLCSNCRRVGNRGTCDTCDTKLDYNGNCRICNPFVDGYHARYPLLFQYSDDETDMSFFGFENEMVYKSKITSNDEMDTVISNIFSSFPINFLQAQRDSSIGAEGFELISQPCTLKVHNDTDWSPFFLNMTTNNNCGLHVHISENTFIGPSHLYKFTNWIHNNEDFCDKISRRESGQYCRKIEEKISSVVKDATNKARSLGSRYQKINMRNLQKIKGTVEVRMFAAARNTMQLLGSIQFCHALVAFTRNSSIKDLDASSFLSFITGKKEYRELNDLCKTVGL